VPPNVCRYCNDFGEGKELLGQAGEPPLTWAMEQAIRAQQIETRNIAPKRKLRYITDRWESIFPSPAKLDDIVKIPRSCWALEEERR